MHERQKLHPKLAEVVLTNNDNKAGQSSKRSPLFATSSDRTWYPEFAGAVVGISIASCKCRMFCRSTLATVCDRIGVGPCKKTNIY